MSVIDDEESSPSSISERSSFIGSESDRSIFSRALSQGGSLMESMSINEILLESMNAHNQFNFNVDQEEEEKIPDDVSFHLTKLLRNTIKG